MSRDFGSRKTGIEIVACTARTSRNGAFIVFGCVVIFLPFCRRLSHFKRLTDMSVKVKYVLDALQQMQKSLECSIWYERTQYSSFALSIRFDKLCTFLCNQY